ncbi:hypothetical protein F2P56_022440 [Juglans regia]|uniref:Uncharacterized protein n=2 Tax=Juglans regia TaxID=51240 RepID=A0A833UQV8_JUGRE|nr:uncharacterized protein LOC108982460 [Juglans regia]KAF5458413.1 hypothetical protein F2P56_022440 [Juglans regia]
MKINVSRNRFLLCFRPVVDMEVVLESKDIVDRSACKEKTIKEMLTPKRTFSRVLLSVICEAILAKRARDRKVDRQESCQSIYPSHKSSYSESCHDFSYERSVNQVSMDAGIDQEVRTNSGLSHSRSSCGSSTSCSGSISEENKSPRSLTDITKQVDCCNYPDIVEKPKEEVDNMGNCSSFESGIYMLAISLVITILWGKFFAIFFTLIWLYFMSGRHFGYGRQENVIKLAETESREYRKKVIIEGLLERKHHHRRH